jgi:hypothetical protein
VRVGPVKSWYPKWKDKVRERVPLERDAWPRGRDKTWDEMFGAFCDAEATELMGQVVLAKMEVSPRLDMEDALAVFRLALSEAARDRDTSGTLTRKQAHARSQGMARCEKWGDPLPCPRCGATGLALYHRRDGQPWDFPTSGGGLIETEYKVMCCDLCPMGRWFAANSTYDDAAQKAAEVIHRDEALFPEEPAVVSEPVNVRAFKERLVADLAESTPF